LPERRPSDSSTSSDEEREQGLRCATDVPTLKELREAISVIPLRKVASPPGSPDHRAVDKTVISSNSLPSELITLDGNVSDGEQSSGSSPSAEPVEWRSMVRKKSGEVVKPSLKSPVLSKRRPQSLPSTPVYPKVVHFDVQLEQIRHFDHAEKPLAVSANASPSDDHLAELFPFQKEYAESLGDKPYQIELTNFPSAEESSPRGRPVMLESVYLSNNGMNLVGKVLVKNLAFSKSICVRFTFDNWQTLSEVSGTYHSSDSEKSLDRFAFAIKLLDFTNLQDRQMMFAIRYRVGVQEFWDNNYNANYKVEFRRRPNYLLRRGVTEGIVRPTRASSVDDFDVDISPETFAKNLAQQISSPTSSILANLGEGPFPKKSPAPLRYTPDAAQKRPTGKGFANRYDFGASLNAAIANASTTIGADKSGYAKPSPSSSESYFAPLPRLFRPSSERETPTESREDYNLVNKIKKTQLAGLHNHHFRSRSYPVGAGEQSPGWQDDVKERYSPDETSKPPMDSLTYLNFLNNYCFVCPYVVHPNDSSNQGNMSMFTHPRNRSPHARLKHSRYDRQQDPLPQVSRRSGPLTRRNSRPTTSST
jgi:Carbohydrate/starch-binding module (family 21)